MINIKVLLWHCAGCIIDADAINHSLSDIYNISLCGQYMSHFLRRNRYVAFCIFHYYISETDHALMWLSDLYIERMQEEAVLACIGKIISLIHT